MAWFDKGGFLAELGPRIAVPSESEDPERLPDLWHYLEDQMVPAFRAMGFTTTLFENPVAGGGPVLLAERLEADGLPVVLGYGHGDVVRGQEGRWREGRDPWVLNRDGDRVYGRGTADNKAQHSLNMAALNQVLEARGRLGFNAKFIIETGEETGSPGLKDLVVANKEAFAADVLIASDGPRVAPDQPTIFLGARGVMNFDLVVDLRDGGHHSGNWGGLLANPGVILAHALASIVGPRGQILVEGLLPPPLGDGQRQALEDIEIGGGEGAPTIDPDWGEPGLTPAERVYAWNSFEVLAFETGNPRQPVNAIPPRARAHCQIRFVAGSDHDGFLDALDRHLKQKGFGQVRIQPPPGDQGFIATRTEPNHPWVLWASSSLRRSAGRPPTVLPSIGGSICNDIFTEVLGLPTIWVPHSYSGCSQHAPDEHILLSIMRDAMALMTGLYWDLGEPGTPKAFSPREHDR